MTDTLETGIRLLDRKLDGGVPVGSIVAVLAPPASQSELFLYELASARPTLYLTSVRRADAVRECLSALNVDDSDVVVAPTDGGAPVDDALRLTAELPDRSTLVLDPADSFEGLHASAYGPFLNELRDRLATAGGVGFLHCLDGHCVPPGRDATEYISDVVFRLSAERNGETVETHLTVPKFRGGRALEDVIKLTLTTGVDVDVSRNIV